MELTFTIIYGILALITASLLRSFQYIPDYELKRRARENDVHAQQLYQVASHGPGMEILMKLLLISFSAPFFVFLSLSFEWRVVLIVSAVFLWLAYLWIPTHKPTKPELLVAKELSTVFSRILHFLRPLLKHISARTNHTGVYEKEDLIRLARKQPEQIDNRIAAHELEVAICALQFSDKKVRDVMIPRGQVRTLSSSDPVSPSLLDDLHKSGYKHFAVMGLTKNMPQGIVNLDSMINFRENQQVADVTSKDIFYINEMSAASEVLNAYFSTGETAFIVVDKEGSFTGVVALQDVLKTFVGQLSEHSFSQYDNLEAVSSKEIEEEYEQKDISERSQE